MSDIEECKRLFVMARDAGARAVKLQKRDVEELYTQNFRDSIYNSENSYGRTYGEHREFLEFSFGQYLELQEFANYLGITFIVTAFDLPSLEFVEALEVPFYKVASGSITNPLLLRKIASLGAPILVSFGGAPDALVEAAVQTLAANGAELVLLHCVAGYPPKPEELSLERIKFFSAQYPDSVIGFSDHDDGISMALVAWSYGARVFEKHITLSHTNKGTDHAFSLEAAGLRSYIGNLNEAHIASPLRDQPQESELEPIYKMGSAVYLNRDMVKGEVVRAENLVLKSPAEGLPGWDYDDIIGQVLVRDVRSEEPLDWAFFLLPPF